MTLERTLDDDELTQLIARCDSRLAELQERGVQVGGLGEHFTHCLLTALLTPEQEKLGREWHYLWLDEALDNAEGQIRKALLTQGMAGNGAGPNREQRRHPA